MVVLSLTFATAFAAATAPAAKAAPKAKDLGASAVLSAMMGGVGEWYNSDFQGGFPWAECIVGYICCFVKLASAIDAADGVTDSGMRFAFWSNPREPKKEKKEAKEEKKPAETKTEAKKK